jgi:cyclic pyranopterin monophosphate synthase
MVSTNLVLHFSLGLGVSCQGSAVLADQPTAQRVMRSQAPVDEQTTAGDGGLTHFDDSGRARMVDVGGKDESERVAVASGRVRMDPATVALIREGRAAKGDVLAVAQVAAVMGAKRTPDLIPMCHPLLLTKIGVAFDVRDDEVRIETTVATRGRTGVEMEALTAVAAAALTIYDMLKAVDRGMTIEAIQLERKEGGQSGLWLRDAAVIEGGG